MDRYYYETRFLQFSVEYRLFDRLGPSGSAAQPIGVLHDVDLAERVVALLNADVRNGAGQ